MKTLGELQSPDERAAVRAPIEKARTLPRRAFVDKDFHAFEVEHALKESWFAVTFATELPDVGDMLPLAVLGIPVLLVRDRNGIARAFHNVCPYDGCEVSIGPQRGVETIITPYHGWKYGLDGRLLEANYWDGTPNAAEIALDSLNADLVPIPCEEWMSTLFVHLGNRPLPFAEQYRPDPANPVIFVILGITDNITDWPPGFHEPLVEAGYCVVRHELRDSGLSTKFEHAGRPDLATAQEALARGDLPTAVYTIHDVAGDAKLLLEHLGIRAACVVGYSFGAAVAQLLALKAPGAVAGLVCLQGSNYNPALPRRLPCVERAMFEATLDYPTREEQVQAMVNLRLATNGSRFALDSREARQSAETSVARMYYPQGTARLILARLAGEPFLEETGRISCPTLILHADEDPIFSLEHGTDMAERIPDARLAVLEGAGHNHPLPLQPIIVEHIAEFAGSSVDWK